MTLTTTGQRALLEKKRPLRRFHQLLSSIGKVHCCRAVVQHLHTPATAERKAGTGGKVLRFAFCQTPAQLLVDNDVGRSVSLRCHRTLLDYADDGSIIKGTVDTQQVRDFGKMCGFTYLDVDSRRM